MINTIEFMDGISFFNSNKEHEIAFYSYITDRIVYYANSKVNYGCVELSYDTNIEILNAINKYKAHIANVH